MKVINKKIDDLIEADYNPRQISIDDFEQLKKSLESFDCVEPAIVNKNPTRENIIVGGHQRIKAAKALEWKTFPCVLVDLTLEREKELNVRLNKNTGEFDYDLLANNFETDDLLEWGFKASDFDISETDEVDETDLSEELKQEIKVEITAKDEEEAEELYNEFTERGLTCKILHL